MKIRTEEELGEALKQGVDTIEIEGDLANKTIRIRATGSVAWIIAVGAIGVAVYALLAAPATAGSSALISGFGASAAVGVLGASVTTAAISIAVAAGGVGALTSLRSYKEVSRTNNSLILRKR